MAVTATPVFVQTPKVGNVQILPADASNLKTIVTGGANGTKVTSLICTSTDTSTRDVQVGITISATFYPLLTVTVAITAGTIAATAAANLFDVSKCPGLPIDSDGNPYIFLPSSSYTLQAKSLTTVTAAKELDITAVAADF
jgi:hypothetical protein